jgi:lysozyme
MTPAQLLTITAAGALLIAAGYAAQRQAEALADPAEDDPDAEPDWTYAVDSALSTARNLLMPTPASEMAPSPELEAMLKAGEALRLHAYRLGDGGWTIGYGRYYPDNGPPPPDEISLEQADAWFAQDLEARGARWVRAYVTVPLTQNQFDALVSMAFNLSPKSFRNIATAVNAGDDPEAAALMYIRAGTNLEHGLRNRRAREVALYRTGVYA